MSPVVNLSTGGAFGLQLKDSIPSYLKKIAKAVLYILIAAQRFAQYFLYVLCFRRSLLSTARSPQVCCDHIEFANVYIVFAC